MGELKKGMIPLTSVESKMMKASNMELEKGKKLLPKATRLPNGLKPSFIEVDDSLMEVAARVNDAEYIQRCIRDGEAILPGGFIYI